MGPLVSPLTGPQKSLLRAMILRRQRLDGGDRPGEQRSVLASSTNMPQQGGSPGPRPDHTEGQMSARPNPLPPPMRKGPPEFDRDLPPGAGEISLGTSQPRGAATRDELPLRHKNVHPRRRSP